MEIPRHWRLKKQRYGLVGDIDPKTGSVAFPPGSKHRYDPETRSRYVEPIQTSGQIYRIEAKMLVTEES
jgi:hypothetical protein